MKILEILRPGPLTTVQDLGRVGYGQYGIPPAGAMDSFALQMGNILVGNPRNAAGLEMTMVGIKTRFLDKAVIAVTGGKGNYTLNGHKIAHWQTMLVEAGDELDIGSIIEGCRAYLVIAGGFTVPDVLGSKSTYLPARVGGWDGRTIQRGDILEGTPWLGKFSSKGLAKSWIPEYPKNCTVRVISGLNQGLFAKDMLESFHSASYEVTSLSNRMGYRLQGEPIKANQTGNLVSDAVVTGTIQVPPDGQPIILAADRQTTGGYPIIGVVASVDFPKVAQLGLGCRISFQEISLSKAQALRLEQERFYDILSFIVKESKSY